MSEWEKRLAVLKDAHEHQHRLVETLEAEHAPDEYITTAKKKKLELKDQIAEIERNIKGYYAN